MKTIFTILMMSIMLSFSYGQQSKAKLHQEEQTQEMVSEAFIDHPSKIIKLVKNQFQNKQIGVKDSKQKLDSILREYYLNDSWELRFINYYEYDDKGNNIIDNNKSVVDTETFIKNEFSYDSIGRVTEVLSESSALGLGAEMMSSTVLYDDHLKSITTQMNVWDETHQEFSKVYLSEVYYNDTNYVIPSEFYDSAFISEWNVDTQKWERFQKVTVSMLENGYESIEYQYMLEDWKVVAKTEVIVTDEETTSTWSQYDYGPQIWTPESKNISLFTNGNLSQSNSFYWDSTTEIWDTGSQEEYSFNLDYSIDDLVLPLDNELCKTSINMLTNSESLLWSSSSEEWVSSKRDTYLYSVFTPTGIDSDFESSSLEVYPNPASDILKVSMANSTNLETEIYNIHGSLIKRLVVNSGDIIHIEDLRPGAYLIKVKSGSESQTLKFIKK